MKKFDSQIYGNIPSPENISELFDLIKQHNDEYFKAYFWRGQSDISWLIHSAAYRRLERTIDEIKERDIQRYENILLDHATQQGYRYDAGRELNDLELLVKLQHHGAATRLIDVSRSLLVGLWFTSSSNPGLDGLLFGFHSSYVGGGENRIGIGSTSYSEAFEDIDDVNHPLVWHPPEITKRIVSQKAQFIYSKTVHHSLGSVAIKDNPDAYIAIHISPEFKVEALKDLKEIFDISYMSLFPDIDGFSYASSARFDQFHYARW